MSMFNQSKQMFFVSSLLVALVSFGSVRARADAEMTQTPVMTGSEELTFQQLNRQRFSVGRFFLESLVGGAVGSAAAYGVYRAACGDEACVGGLAGLAANFAVTPLAVWGLGRATGGRGSLGRTYMGGVLALGAGASVTMLSPVAALGFGSLLMPFACAGVFEGSSHVAAKEELARRGAHVSLRPSVMPLDGARGVSASLLVSGQF
jgi:hypothetical protein